MPNNGTFSANGSVISDRPGRPSTSYATLAASGTWGGGTLKATGRYYISDGTTFDVDLPSVSLSANGLVSFAHNADQIIITLSGATTPSLKWAVV